jgi:alpha-ketoglutarate-dependent taurine dioxygenase
MCCSHPLLDLPPETADTILDSNVYLDTTRFEGPTQPMHAFFAQLQQPYHSVGSGIDVTTTGLRINGN